MPSAKIYNKDTGKWQIVGSSQANELSIIDVENNFTEKNVEAAIRNLAEQTRTTNAEFEGTKNALSTLAGEFNEHITNHPSGGGGGGGTGGGCTITSSFQGGVIDSDTDLYIPLFFTPSVGASSGTAFIMINDIEVGNQMIQRGNNRIHIGVLTEIKNTISIYAKDNKGGMSTLLTFEVIKGGIDFNLQFDYNADYSIDDTIKAAYNITSPLETPLVLEVTIDNVKKEIPITRQGFGEYTFVGLGIGVHPVTMIVTSGIYRSKLYSFNLVIVSSYNLYVSSTFKNAEYESGVPIIFDYRISKLSSELFDVELKLNNITQKTLKLPTGSYTWTIPGLGVGLYNIKVEVRSATSEFASVGNDITVFAGEYVPVQEVKGGLLASFSSQTMTNNDLTKEIWTDLSGNNVVATLHNFNFSTNGWIEQDVGNGVKERVLRCDNEAYVEIDMKPYLDNVKLGSTIDILYRSKNIGFEDARVIDYTDIDTPYKGIYANINQAVFKSATNTGTVFLDEDTETRLTFVVDRTNKFGLVYINGVINRAFYLSDTGSGVNRFYEDFTHGQKIYLNCEKGLKNFGAVDIKRFRVYGRALTSDEVLQNHLADIEDITKQKDRYKFNFENKTTPAIKIYCPEDQLKNMSDVVAVPCRVKYESPNEDFFGASFDLPRCDVNWQGTSSLQYILKNYTIRLKDESGAPYYYTPYKNGIKETVFCMKCDYMESSHAHNVGMAKFINSCVYDTKTPAQLKNDKCRTTIDGFPILLYVNDELKGAYNFNLDRYSTESFGFKNFSKCLSYEVSANSDTTGGAFHKWTSASGKTEIDYYRSDFEILYPPSRVGNDNFAELIRLVNWVDGASDELFKEQINEYFNKEYLLRYYLTVMVIGAVDNLGFWLK